MRDRGRDEGERERGKRERRGERREKEGGGERRGGREGEGEGGGGEGDREEGDEGRSLACAILLSLCFCDLGRLSYYASCARTVTKGYPSDIKVFDEQPLCINN